MKPVVFDLFCGLGGWSQAFLDLGFRSIGFDIEAHDYGNGGYPGELVLRDIRSITGTELVKQYGVPACIVASPPCQEFSYMAMPWSKAKEKERKILADPQEQKRLTDLFNQCFRIQREVSAAAGNYVPIVIENVRGAQKWVGKARWNFGSFYLWGDVPALMPIPAKVGMKGSVGTINGSGKHREQSSWDRVPSEGNKTSGMNWSDQTKRGQDFTRIAGNQAMEGVKMGDSPRKRFDERPKGNIAAHREGTKMLSENGRRTDIDNGAQFTSRDCDNEGVKGFTPHGQPLGKNELGRKHGSKSKARKQASAEIAKIPPALAQWIAKCFKPKDLPCQKAR